MKSIIKEHFENEKHGALLIIGPGASESLKSLYETVPEYLPDWIESPADQAGFWLKFLDGMKAKPERVAEQIRYMKKNGYVGGCMGIAEETLRKRGSRHHLFLPGIDKMFYKMDIEGGNSVNGCLRALWQPQENNLNIYGSAEDPRSREYEATLGDYDFGFYVNNFTVLDPALAFQLSHMFKAMKTAERNY